MSDETPMCPRLTAAALVMRAGEEAFAVCAGSRCALWVPEAASAEYFIIDNGEPSSGRGWCVENTYRVPWPDPAGAE